MESPDITQEFIKEFKEFKEIIKRSKNASNLTDNLILKGSNIEKAVDIEKLSFLKDTNQHIKDILAQIRTFRKVFFYFLTVIMSIETIILFSLVIISSLGIIKIEQSTLQILVTATIAQVSAMVYIIIKSIFPEEINKIILTGVENKKI